MACIESLYICNECFYNYRIVKTSMTRIWKPLSWDNYDLVHNILTEGLSKSHFNFNNQLARLRTHNLFNIVVSQFRGSKYLRHTVKEINQRFSDCPDYARIVSDAQFDALPYKAIKILLKHRLFYICGLYAFFKKYI